MTLSQKISVVALRTRVLFSKILINNLPPFLTSLDYNYSVGLLKRITEGGFINFLPLIKIFLADNHLDLLQKSSQGFIETNLQPKS